MTKLKWLFMSNNNLSGSIPAELGNLGSLEVLDLASNALSGTLPDSLCQRSTLSIYLDHQGDVPPVKFNRSWK
ncbi:hypothetical protein KC19_8G027100 [Ceratodon purpureus]|uniref:Uncharacterized protein n=1 Tax=Ceratodon purpureus TaxID=3225 RepID=A0A8T0H023_CERPU|nr:hypothetical protein KC19_8G027100 [Ceratodon purpureus]